MQTGSRNERPGLLVDTAEICASLACPRRNKKADVFFDRYSSRVNEVDGVGIINSATFRRKGCGKRRMGAGKSIVGACRRFVGLWV